MTDGIRCSRCAEVLPVEAFAPSHRKTGDWCRICRKLYMAGYGQRQVKKPPTPRFCRNEGCDSEAAPRSPLCQECREKRATQPLPARQQRTCPLCGRRFETTQSRTRFCSSTCNAAADSILAFARGRWALASVWRGVGNEGLTEGPVLPVQVLVNDVTNPLCPECFGPTRIVNDEGDYGCHPCYVKVSLLRHATPVS